MAVYQITLRKPAMGTHNLLCDAADTLAAKRLATVERARAGHGWTATLYRVDDTGALDYVATRTPQGWQ